MIGICFNQTGIHSKPLPAYPAFCNAPGRYRLKYMAEYTAVSKPAVTVLGKLRIIWNAITKIKAAEPTIYQVQINFFA